MKVNLSILFLNFMSISNSPLITNNPCSFSITNTFLHISINNIFNTFFYQNDQNTLKNILIFRQSIFSNSLNSAIYLASDTVINSSQIFTDQQIYDGPGRWSINIDNCCFSGCRSISSQPHGGAIRTKISDSVLNITSCIFKNCYAETWGGAIMSESQNFYISSTIFSGCQAETGMALFYNLYKVTTLFGYHLTLNQIGFTSNTGNHDVNDINISEMNVLNTNFSNNINAQQNQPTSAVQYCCALSFLAPTWNQNLKFINLIGNKGDFLIDFNEKPNGQCYYVNIIGNTGLNYFFHFDLVMSNPLNGEPFINMNNFNFFNNKANSETVGILIGNQGTPVQFKLKNCLFDYSSDQLNSMLNGHIETGGQFDLSISPGVTHTMGEVFVKPSICEIDGDYFTQSNSFSPSERFSDSNFFSNSERFSKSGFFTRSEFFSETYSFTSSSQFSMSFQFSSSSSLNSPSSLFTNSPSFSPSSLEIYSDSSVHPTDPFTPSSHFTPSNSFSPIRTKIPDPMNILHQADVSGKKNIFTKEELKKAAAPASISFILIIVAIIMTVYYINRRIKALKYQDFVPEFDSSLYDETETDSEYSYSYYTYTYTYTYNYSDSDYSYYYDSYDSYHTQTSTLNNNVSGYGQFNRNNFELGELEYSDFTYEDDGASNTN